MIIAKDDIHPPSLLKHTHFLSICSDRFVLGLSFGTIIDVGANVWDY